MQFFIIVVVYFLVSLEIQLGVIDLCSGFLWVSIEHRWLAEFEFMGLFSGIVVVDAMVRMLGW